MASSPFEPAGGVAGWFRMPEGVGEQALDLADGERDKAGISRWLAGRAGWRGLGAVLALSCAAVTVQIARTAMTSTMCRRIAV